MFFIFATRPKFWEPLCWKGWTPGNYDDSLCVFNKVAVFRTELLEHGGPVRSVGFSVAMTRVGTVACDVIVNRVDAATEICMLCLGGQRNVVT